MERRFSLGVREEEDVESCVKVMGFLIVESVYCMFEGLCGGVGV